MTLSDEILAVPGRHQRIRAKLAELLVTANARAGFLVDEGGIPFAAVGHIEFELPHPVSRLDGGNALLSALIGEPQGQESEHSDWVVTRASDRALLAIRVGPEASLRARRQARREMERLSPSLHELLLL